MSYSDRNRSLIENTCRVHWDIGYWKLHRDDIAYQVSHLSKSIPVINQGLEEAAQKYRECLEELGARSNAAEHAWDWVERLKNSPPKEQAQAIHALLNIAQEQDRYACDRDWE